MKFNPKPTRIRRAMCHLLGIGAFLATLCTVNSAHAQFGGQAGFAEAFQKDFMRRDMQLFVDYLRLEDWQRPVIEVLLDDYQISFDAGTDACKNAMTELKNEMIANPDQAMEIALRPIKAWETEKRQLRDVFIDNVKTQLSPLQMQRWANLERAMRREKELPRGELPGESMNIFATLYRMELSTEAINGIDPILATYEVVLDNALAARRKAMEKHQPKLQDAMVSRDYEAGLSGLRSIMTARATVCDSHFNAIEEIRTALPGETGDEFAQLILSAGFPDIFKRTSVDRLIDSVRVLDSLTDDQIAELDIIEAEYNIAIDESNSQLLQAHQIYGREIPILQAKRSIARRNNQTPERGSDVPEEISQLKTERDKMLEHFRNRLLDLLSPEQANQIPAAAKYGRTVKTRDTANGPGTRQTPSAPSNGNQRGAGVKGRDNKQGGKDSSLSSASEKELFKRTPGTTQD